MFPSASISKSILMKFASDFRPILETRIFFGKVIDDLLQRSLNDIIQSSSTDKGVCKKCRLELNKILKNLLKTDKETDEKVTKAMRRALHGCFVLVVNALSIQGPWTLFETNDELLEKYPSFSSCTPDELEVLLTYRNYMAVSIALKQAEGNKEFHMDNCTRLSEGADVKYVTGSGQSNDTSRRVEIYETEGGVTKKTKRVRDEDNGSTYCESSVSSNSKRSRSGSISSIEISVTPSRNTAAQLTFNPKRVFSGLYTPETESTLVELLNDVIDIDGEDFSVITTVTPISAALEVIEWDDLLEEGSLIDGAALDDLVTPNSAALEEIEWDDSSLNLFEEDSLIDGAALDDLVLE